MPSPKPKREHRKKIVMVSARKVWPQTAKEEAKRQLIARHAWINKNYLVQKERRIQKKAFNGLLSFKYALRRMGIFGERRKRIMGWILRFQMLQLLHHQEKGNDILENMNPRDREEFFEIEKKLEAELGKSDVQLMISLSDEFVSRMKEN